MATLRLDSHTVVIPGEDPAELDALAGEYHQQFQPRTPVERYLVNTLVNCDWLRRRLMRLQAELFRAVMMTPDHDSPLFGFFQNGGFGQDGLQRLFNQLTATDRNFFRALSELRRIQQPPAPGPLAVVPAPVPEIGFVPLNPAAARLPAPAPAPGPWPPARGPAQIGFVPPNTGPRRSAAAIRYPAP